MYVPEGGLYVYYVRIKSQIMGLGVARQSCHRFES